MPQSPAIALLKADPELGEAIPGVDRPTAERVLTVATQLIEPGPWDPVVEDPPAIGLLIVSGVLTRDLVFAGRTTTELLGVGDIIRPWVDDQQFDPLPFEVSWHAHTLAQVAQLDARIAMACGRWPDMAAAIATRFVRRARSLAFQRAIAQIPRVDERLLVLLWSLAERWGRVSPEGVRLPLALPHRTLATLVGARRPSVTTALSGLARDGLVERTPEGWMLHGDPADVLRARVAGTERALA
ncbi:MAG: helix-turn-helix domain-containing protein [Actinomycetota bacterium]|nr:helix-turn-helix domain-containing protein [Actinomycetota bacterium]